MGKQLPNNWVEVTIESIGNIISGSGFPKEFQGNPSGDYPFFKVGDISNEVKKGKHYIDTSENYIDKGEVELLKAKILPQGSIVFAKIGEALKLNRRAILDQDSIVDNNAMGINVFNNVYRNKLLYYYLKTVDLAEFSSGNTVPSVRKSVIEKMMIPLPPLKEQQRITQKLDAIFGQLDDVKTRLATIPDLLKNFRQSVLNQAVTGKLTEDWRKGKELGNADNWRKSVIEERKKLKLPKRTPGLEYEEVIFPYDIPENWTFGYLQNFGEFTRGKSKHRPRNDKRLFGGKYPFIQTGDVARSNGLIENYTQTYSEFGLAQSRLFPKGTLCITIAANIAETGILDFDSCFPDSVVGYLPYKNMYSSKFAMYYLRTIQQDLEHYAPATAQKNINLGILFKVAFPVPPKEEQTEIVKRVDKLFSKADQIQLRYEALVKNIENLPQAILQKAFKGDLVEQLPTDGDAKALLGEILKLKEEAKKTIKTAPKKKSKKSQKKQLVGKSEGKSIVKGTLTTKEDKVIEDVFNNLKNDFSNKKFTFGEIQIPSKYTYDEFRIQLFKLLDDKTESKPKLNMVYHKDILYFQITKK